MTEQAEAVTTAPLFDPLSPAFIRDPYPHYERLRRSDPVHISQHGMYIVSRHADVTGHRLAVDPKLPGDAALRPFPPEKPQYSASDSHTLAVRHRLNVLLPEAILPC